MDNKHEVTFSEFRFIRIIFVKHPHASHGPLEDMSIAIHSATTFKDIQTVLEIVERGQWTVLQTVFGAIPYWRVPMSETSHIGANCQTLYAVESLEYVLAVVRGPHSDYPIALDPGDLQNLSEAVFVAAPELKTITKAITGYSGIELIQDNIVGYIEEQRDKPHFPTVFMITTDDRPGRFQFDLELVPEAPALYLLYIECKDLVRQSYNVEHYTLQILHVSEALVHAIVSLSRALETMDSFGILLKNLEKYSRIVAEILNAANNENLNQGEGTRVKWMVNELFLHLCEDYPGAVAIRDSHVGFERLKEFDEETETERLAQPPTSRLGNRISRLVRCLLHTRRNTDSLHLEPKISCPNESNSKRALYLKGGPRTDINALVVEAGFLELDIIISTQTKYRVTLRIDKNNIKIQQKGGNLTWAPFDSPELMDSSKITLALTSGHKLVPFGKREALVEISGKEAREVYWESVDSISRTTTFDEQPVKITFKFRPSRALENAHDAVQNLQTAVENCQTIAASPTEQPIDSIIEYGSVVSELLKDLRKYDEMVSDLASWIEPILLFATHLLEEILYDETELLDGAVCKLYEVITETAVFVIGYAKRSSTSQGAKSAISVSDRQKFQALQQAFGKLKEDFDRAVDITALDVTRRKEEFRLLDRLKPSNAPNYQEDHSCFEGTCVAILDYIASWVAKSVPRDTRSHCHDSSNLFWLYGMPGVGKTSVANSLSDRLRSSGNLAGSFFCRRDDPLCEPTRVLPTLIYKLLEMWGPFRKMVAQVLYDEPQLNPESTRGEVLLKALKLLTRYPSRTMVLVIDALDECGEPDTRAPLLQCLREACAHAPWLKIIVTSRPECDITLFFNRHAVTSRDLAAALPPSSKSKPLT